MWNRFTEETRRAIFFAQEEAARHHQRYVGTEHVLMGLLRLENSECESIFKTSELDGQALRNATEAELAEGEIQKDSEMEYTPRAKRAIDDAWEEAQTMNLPHIGPTLLLLGLIREAEGGAGQILAQHGITLGKAREIVSSTSV